MKTQIKKIFSTFDICYKKISNIAKKGFIKNIFSKTDNIGKKQLKNYKTLSKEEIDLYSLNRYQLKNLIDKNIYFGFFQLEDFSFSYDKSVEHLLNKVKRKNEKELLLDLKSQDLKQPLILICNRGYLSRTVAQKLRDQGFINVYFVEGGLKALLETEE